MRSPCGLPAYGLTTPRKYAMLASSGENRMAKDKNDEKLLKLSETAQACGVSKQTVEYYILIGLVKPLRRNGRRLFDDKLIRRIRLIKQLNDSGYTLGAIRETFRK